MLKKLTKEDWTIVFKRIALRCEKTAIIFASFLAFALVIILVEPSTRPKLSEP